MNWITLFCISFKNSKTNINLTTFFLISDAYTWLLEWLVERDRNDPRRAAFLLEHLCRLPPYDLPISTLGRMLRRLIKRSASIPDRDWRSEAVKINLVIVSDAISPGEIIIFTTTSFLKININWPIENCSYYILHFYVYVVLCQVLS